MSGQKKSNGEPQPIAPHVEAKPYRDGWKSFEAPDLEAFLDVDGLTVVPEPSTWAMIMVGAGLIFVTQRLRRKRS